MGREVEDGEIVSSATSDANDVCLDIPHFSILSKFLRNLDHESLHMERVL